MLLLGLPLLLVIALPFYAGHYIVSLVTVALLYAYLAQSWNIVGGYGGQFSLMEAVYFGVGGYTATMLSQKLGLTPYLGLIGGVFLAVLFAIFIGSMSFKFGLKGIYFGVTTLVFSELIRLVALNWYFIGGAWGLQLKFKNDPLNFQFLSDLPYLYIILGMVIAVTYLVYRIDKNKIGYYFLAIREKEEAAESLGVNTYKYKIKAVILSAIITSIGGVFYAQYTLFLEPNANFSLEVVIKMLLGTIIGGKGTIFGPVVGSLVLTGLDEGIRLIPLKSAQSAGMTRMIYGTVIVLTAIFMPNGILGWIAERTTRRRTKMVSE